MGASLAAWLVLSFALCFTSASSKASVTPIQKVLTMLGGMLERAKAGKHDEQVEWSAYKTFCTNTELVKQKAIQEADVQKDSLKAEKEQHDSEVKRLTKEVSDHESDIDGYEKDEKKATKDRKAERETYDKTHADYSESVTAIGEAIGVLKKQAADIPQSSALLQTVAGLNLVPAATKRAIDNYLDQGETHQELALIAAPEANAYEFQSSTIVTMLEELKDKFIDERTALEKKELIARQAYETVMLDLRNSISTAKNEIDKKSDSKTEHAGGSVDAAKLFGEVSDSRDDDQKYLDGLISTCQQKSKDFESRQQLRSDEIEAIEKAIEIISGDDVSGAAAKHLPSLLQARHGQSFVQFLAVTGSPSNQEKAAQFLSEESHRLQSHILSAIALQASADPFEKVKKMIADLIKKLKAEEAAEADHKKWCDEELGTNEKTRKDKTTEVDSLTSDIDQLESRLAVLKKELAVLSKEIAEINSAVAKATEIRTEEKDKNEATIVEAVKGQTAIAEAQKILKEFYKKAGEAKALVQTAEEPEIFDEAYQGQQKSNNNVMAFLDVIASDFSRLETDTKKEEETSQTEYDDLMASSKKSKEAKEKEEKDKKKEQLEKSQTLESKNDDLESAHKQLDAALAYFDKLKPSCINQASPYDERVQRREEEVASLKEALEILNGEGLAPQPEALYSGTQGGNLAVDYR
jgi:hypothetical protein